jgi:hypothetical protein
VFQHLSCEPCDWTKINFINAIAGEFCSAGILPVICFVSKIEKTAGKMPAPRGTDYVESDRAA